MPPHLKAAKIVTSGSVLPKLSHRPECRARQEACMMRFLATFSAVLSLLCLAACSQAPSTSAFALDGPSDDSADSVSRSYADAILVGMARARAERLRKDAARMGRPG
jgi:hypothetical protein